MTKLTGHSALPAQQPFEKGMLNSAGSGAGCLARAQSGARLGTDAYQDEYTTYAPKGEKCRRCHKHFGSLEVVRRVRPSGEEPNGRPYAHLECLAEGKS